jgi:outer membrane protein OmpA-like peptidoglycan-associated protein
MKNKVSVVIRFVGTVALGLLTVCVLMECRSGLRGDNQSRLRVTIADAPGNVDMSLTEGNRDRLTTVSAEDEELVLNAEVTESGGEIMAQGKLSPLTVTALHRNIAERGGKVRLSFDMRVSRELLAKDRQLRVVPKLMMDEDTMLLDRIFVTGAAYRAEQLKGYERYNKYFASIIPDSVDFLKAFGYLGLLKYFTQRNIEDRPRGEFGVTEPEAIDYYIKHYLVRLNRRRKDRLEEVFRKCVKDPIDRLGIRLDTVLRDPSGGLTYRYVQDLPATRDMRRLRMCFAGSVHSYGNTLYRFNAPDTLTWYVSSLTQMADTSAIYRKQTLARDVEASTLAFIEFEKGSWTIDTTLGNNADELERIRREFDSLAVSKRFTADSVIICASCSPDGSYMVNQNLSHKRAESIMEYFSSAIKNKLRMHTEHIPENWDLLKEHIIQDSNVRNKDQVLDVFSERDPDKREELLSKCADFKYIREKLYPLLRRIDFTFRLHRRIYDTISTEVVPDEAYKEGIRSLMDRDFKKAVGLLRPYADINTAIAYLCMDYNASALSVLGELERNSRTNYLTALVYSRLGDERKAMEYFRSAIAEDPRLRFRASLDPEMERLLEQLK